MHVHKHINILKATNTYKGDVNIGKPWIIWKNIHKALCSNKRSMNIQSLKSQNMVIEELQIFVKLQRQ